MTGPREGPGCALQALRRLQLWDRHLALMMAVGLAIRCALAFALDGHMTLRGDEGAYTRLAPGFFSSRFDTGPFVRPPLYFVFLALTRAISSPEAWLLNTKLIQCLAGTAVAIPVYRSTLRLAGVRAGRFAIAFILFDPTLIAFTHLLWPETLFLLVVAIVFDGVADINPGAIGRSAVLGALTGVAMLLKPVFGIFTLALALHWVVTVGLKDALRIALVFGGTTALVISPWVIRNLELYGPSIVMENQGPYNLWSGNATDPPKSILNEWVALGDPVTRSEVGTQRGVEAIKHAPARFARNTAVRALNLWGLEYFVVRHLAIGGYQNVSKAKFLTWFWIIQIGWTVTWLSAAAGIGPLVRDPPLRLAIAYSAALTAIVSVMVTTTRFRVPFAFWIAVAAGIGADRILAHRIGRRTVVLIGAALVVLTLSATRPMFRKIITMDFQATQELSTEEWRFFRY